MLFEMDSSSMQNGLPFFLVQHAFQAGKGTRRDPHSVPNGAFFVVVHGVIALLNLFNDVYFFCRTMAGFPSNDTYRTTPVMPTTDHIFCRTA
jgi:hypothetical protein